MIALTSCFKVKRDSNEKVLNLRIRAQVKGMDPVQTDDLYSGREAGRVYEGLLRFHYLKRPYVLEPNLAESLPEVSEDGLTYTFKIKKGIVFQDNKCFPNGKGRELEAKDFVFSLKRLADPVINSPGWWLMQNKIAGLDEWRKANTGKSEINYDADVEGLQALDKYTLQFKLKRPFPQFQYGLAMGFTFAVPREAVEFYGKDFINHPVGTGPWILPKFTQSNKIVYKKNPTFRDDFYPTEGGPGDKEKGFLKDAGKKVPFLDRLVIHIVEEGQPAWLNVRKGNYDFLRVPSDQFNQAMSVEGGLKPEIKALGFQLDATPDLDVTFRAFNNIHPLFKDNVKLRRAMSLGIDTEEMIKLFYNGQGIPAQGPIPPGIAGYDPDYKSPYIKYDVKEAKRLLAEAGYPGGKGLPEIVYDTSSSSIYRQLGTFFKKQMAGIGIKVKVITNPWPELQRKVKTASNMMYGMAWGADYPDAENFLQLMYGPNKSPGANGSNYDNPEFNALYKKAALMQHSPERTKIYKRLNQIGAEDVPWIFGLHRVTNHITTGWFKNYKYTALDFGSGRFYNMDPELKKELSPKL